MPKGRLAHFSITNLLISGDVAGKKMFFELAFEEHHEIPGDFDNSPCKSKGLTGITVQDFPNKRKAVYFKDKAKGMAAYTFENYSHLLIQKLN